MKKSRSAAYVSAGSAAAKYFPPGPVIRDPESSSSFEIIKQWQRRRERAKFPQEDRRNDKFMPTRLIAISRENGVFQIRLHEPAQGEVEPWLALSYCWGHEQSCTTTKASLALFRDSIDHEQLPRTIQDAVLVTYNLGYQYLWVDCLCIMQDDPVDVEYQLSQARKVYSLSEITIVAARAASCDEGFLQPTTTPNAKDHIFRVQYKDADGLTSPINLYTAKRPAIKHYDPIESRAWCLQEFLLPRNILCYGSSQTWWMGDGAIHHDGLDSNVETHSRAAQLRMRFQNLYFTQTRRYVQRRANDTWLAVVHDFSLRSLSQSSDKLSAIAGLAERYSAEMKTAYAAGLFVKYIPETLGWSRAPSSHAAARPAQYRAPSWSWASIDSRVRWPFHRYPAEHFEVQGCHVEPVSEQNPFAHVKSGYLIVRGRTRKAEWFPSQHRIVNNYLTEHDLRIHAVYDALDSEHDLPPESSIHVTCLELSNSGYIDFSGDDLNSPATFSGPTGLILVPASNAGDFRRVGWFAFAELSNDGQDCSERSPEDQEIVWRQVDNYDRKCAAWFDGCAVEALKLV